MRPELLDYELLSKARAWLKNRDHWIKHRMGAGVKFNTTENLADAKATCAIGALARAAGIEPSAIDGLHAYRLLKGEVPPGYDGHVVYYNDAHTTTHKDILALFTRAMTKAKKLATAPLRG